MSNLRNYNNKNTIWGNKPNMQNQANAALQPQQIAALNNLNQAAAAAAAGMVPFQQQHQQVFPNIGLNQQNIGLGLQQMATNSQLNASLAANQIFQQQLNTVAYPNTRALNPNAFQTHSAAASTTTANNLQNSNAAVAGGKPRVFTGVISQLHDSFGFIDDEVFFPRNVCVKGSTPSIGDRVVVEAAFNPSMPFKWNATRVQVIQTQHHQQPQQQQQQQPPPPQHHHHHHHQHHHQQQQPQPPQQQQPSSQYQSRDPRSGASTINTNISASTPKIYSVSAASAIVAAPNSGSYNAVPPPLVDSKNSFPRRSETSSTSATSSSRADRPKITIGERRNRSRDRDDDELDRKRRREDRARDREREEKKSPIRRRSRSPKIRRRVRVVPRYMVQMPKVTLDLPQADVLEVKRRYSNLYIPSDFFSTTVRWVDAFPPYKPYALNRPCSFHIMSKDADPIEPNDAILEPVDADYKFCAKVMLMSISGIEEIYQKCFAIAEDKEKRDRDSEERDYVHPTRLINFLVGTRGKNETMAIGGPWSPSLDGENPENDPVVLIKTAIRTCKALTGIDLSNCTQWFRFLELYYRRNETTHKGKPVPARVETVVFFLPDVWSCLPNRLEWEQLQQSYRKHLETILKGGSGSSGGGSGSGKTAGGGAAAAAAVAVIDEQEDDINDDSNGGNVEKDEDAITEKSEPTPHSQLDPKVMNVADLRGELKVRGIDTKGGKAQLVTRLLKALKMEAGKNDADSAASNVNRKATEVNEEMDEEERSNSSSSSRRKSQNEERKLDEQQKRYLTKRYTLPEQPQIIVYPSKTAKSGKYDCATISLSLLLDYGLEDTKEHSFEVSLFAELFNEMLARDFGFNIFKALYELPDKSKEKDDDKKKKISGVGDNDKRKDRKDDDMKKSDKKDDRDGGSNDSRDDEKKRDSKKDDRRSDSSGDEDDDDSSSRRDRRSDRDRKKKDKLKLYTKDKQLLLSFVYFDQTQCGYIFDKDLEELLFALGLNLSRSQIKKLISKVIVRDSLHYRKLTDKCKIDDKDYEESPISSSSSSPCSSSIDWREVATGNKRLLPAFASKQDKQTENDGTVSSSDSNLTVYQGAVIDIGKLLMQLEKHEKARIVTEQHMIDLKNEYNKLQEKYAKANSNTKHLNSELKDYKEKLRSVEDALIKSNAHAKLYQSTLMDIRDKVEPVLKSSTSHKDRDRESGSGDRKKSDESKTRWEKDRDVSKNEKEKDNKKDYEIKKENEIVVKKEIETSSIEKQQQENKYIGDDGKVIKESDEDNKGEKEAIS